WCRGPHRHERGPSWTHACRRAVCLRIRRRNGSAFGTSCWAVTGGHSNLAARGITGSRRGTEAHEIERTGHRAYSYRSCVRNAALTILFPRMAVSYPPRSRPAPHARNLETRTRQDIETPFLTTSSRTFRRTRTTGTCSSLNND